MDQDFVVALVGALSGVVFCDEFSEASSCSLGFVSLSSLLPLSLVLLGDSVCSLELSSLEVEVWRFDLEASSSGGVISGSVMPSGKEMLIVTLLHLTSLI